MSLVYDDGVRLLAAYARGERDTEAGLIECLSNKWFRINTLYKIKPKPDTDEDGNVSVIKRKGLIPFKANEIQADFWSRKALRNVILKARQFGFCLASDTRVLTASLEWVRIDSLTPGQEIVAVDEHPPGGRGSARRMKTATVYKAAAVYREAYRITFDDGRSVVCTDTHPWLTRKKATDARWRSLSGKGNAVVGKIAVGTQVRWVARPWGESDHEDGWFGGMLDGEGSISKTNVAAGVSVSQRIGPVWDRLVRYAAERGYNARIENDPNPARPSKFGSTAVPKLAFGRLDELFRLIGQTRPTRFIGNRFWEGRELPGKRNGDVGWSTVVRVESLGPRKMIDLQTSAKTYIAEGFVSHNTTLEMLDSLDTVLFVPNVKIGIVCHKREDAEAIFSDKIQIAYENIPAEWLDIFDAIGLDFPTPVSDRAGGYDFSNGSKIDVSTSYRGGTLRKLHVSEFGRLCRRAPKAAKEVVTGAFEAVPISGELNIESTAEGRDGYFWQYCREAAAVEASGAPLTDLDFKFFFYPWFRGADYVLPDEDAANTAISAEEHDYFDAIEAKTGTVLTLNQRAWYVKKSAKLQEDMTSEYPSTWEEAFEQSIQGAYYAKTFYKLRKMGRIRKVPYDPRLPVYTFWDLGRNDYTAIWFMQYGWKEYRLIRYYENSGENIQFYGRKLREFEYSYGTVYLPHDAEVVDYSQGENLSRKEILQGMGYNVVVVPRVPDKIEAIQAVRDVLFMCVFDEALCKDGIKALESYRKEWDDSRGHWKDTPFRGPEKHGADAFEQLARGFSLYDGEMSFEPDEYDY